jgi:hypothetical protein
MIIGFDASTSCVGFAFYDGKEIIDAGFLDISKQVTNKEKVLHVISVIEGNPNISKIKQINLEAALSGFMGGKTSQQTIIKLARFNAIFEYIISEEWALPVNLVGVNTARKKVFGKCREKGMKSKVYVRQQIDNNFTYIHKFDKLNTRKTWDSHNEDMYDACIIAMA